MKDILQDIIAHTSDLGVADLIKIKGDDKTTTISGIANDRSVVTSGTILTPVPEFKGTFGMPNMNTLKTIIGLEPYKENATITIKSGKNGPENMHFQNEEGDFQNDYRFMVQTIVDKMLKEVKFKGANWHVEIEPKEASIMRLKYQAQAMMSTDESTFQATVKDGNLIFTFGDHSTHAGEFIFEANVAGTLKRDWHWPTQSIINILSLVGDKIMKFSDDGAMEMTVNSGLAEYTYTLPAQTK